jgi:hypothetical protein
MKKRQFVEKTVGIYVSFVFLIKCIVEFFVAVKKEQ